MGHRRGGRARGGGRKGRALKRLPLLGAVVLVVVAGVFACVRVAPETRSPAPPPVATGTPPSVVPSPAPTAPAADFRDLDPRADSLRDEVLAALPDGAEAQPQAEEVRREGSLRWRHVVYTVTVPTTANLKVVTGHLVRAAEESGGVVVASRPQDSGQVIEIGLEAEGKVLPVLRILLRLRTGSVVPFAQPRVAIILDDAGGNLGELTRALAIGRPVALAILPGLRHSTELAREATASGLVVMLHQPMEPDDAAKVELMGPGGVHAAMTDEQIARVVAQNLDGLPGVVGVNNHMGSRGTADARVVRAVLRVVQQRGLFFVDSRTSPHSVVDQVAAELGVPVAARAVFLDNSTDPEAIRTQVRLLIRVARERGSAVAIGHANRPNTAEVLRDMVAEIESAGVRIVSVREIVGARR
ncbi:MAG: divergent polysaccharide deacetylase family protein [Armatimonadota bacterium]|nr:divergent polysaccharide deacetylase family protein [Armatimonadota bacterium]MDR5696821.1 divergent polysaccharide deacetylase family protein [Armatimonadota bacterium]